MLPRLFQSLSDAQPVRLLAYGASISEVGRTPNWFGGASRAELNWGQQLASSLREAFPRRDIEMLHFGIGGQNTYELLGRFDWMPNDIDVVMIQVGTNDCGFHEIPPQATATALASLIDAIRFFHKADVILMGSAGDNPRNPVLQHVVETQQAMRQVAHDKGVDVVMLREAVLSATDNGATWAQYHDGETGVHPNDRGMTVWAAAAFAALQQQIPL